MGKACYQIRFTKKTPLYVTHRSLLIWQNLVYSFISCEKCAVLSGLPLILVITFKGLLTAFRPHMERKLAYVDKFKWNLRNCVKAGSISKIGRPISRIWFTPVIRGEWLGGADSSAPPRLQSSLYKWTGWSSREKKRKKSWTLYLFS